MKGKSKGFENFTISMLKDLDRFSDHTYHKKTDDIAVDESHELKEIKEKLEKYKVLDDILDNLDQPKLEALLKK